MTTQEPVNYESEWTESGLLDDFDGQVTDAYFATDARVRNGEVLCLFLKMQTNDPENPETEQRWTCGPGWSSQDGGKHAVHVDDRPDKLKKFNNNSGYGRFIVKMVKLGMGDVIAAGGGPRSVQVWVGAAFHWRRETIDYGGDIGERTMLLPESIIGVGAVAPVAQAPMPMQPPAPPVSQVQVPAPPLPAAPVAAAPVPPGMGAVQPVAPPAQGVPAPPMQPVISPQAGQVATGGSAFDAARASVDPGTLNKLQAFAKAQDYSKWMDTALDLQGVAENATLVDAIANEAFYTELRS